MKLRWIYLLSAAILTIWPAVTLSEDTLATDVSAQAIAAQTPVTIGLLPDRSYASTDRTVRFTTDFPGGKIDQLIEHSPDEFEVVIKPEAQQINDSAWYAFRVESDAPRTINVRLRYVDGSHRYRPKLSDDRIIWKSADDLIVSRDPDGRQVTLAINVTPDPVWIAGQEVLSNKDVDAWIEQLQTTYSLRRTTLGQSVLDRPIHCFTFGNEHAKDSVFLLSRQHPPEVTGMIGMQFFVERLLADDEMAVRFRQQFQTVAVPVANPDGVALGYWRTNANGVDLNRDWEHFQQPETKAIHTELMRLNSIPGGRVWLFLDFHSTYEDVFYTVPVVNDLFPKGFTKNWLAAIDQRTPRYSVIRDASHNPDFATSKVWISREFGIHAITYEFGDETDRELILRVATISAEEMMRELLSKKAEDSSQTANPPKTAAVP